MACHIPRNVNFHPQCSANWTQLWVGCGFETFSFRLAGKVEKSALVTAQVAATCSLEDPGGWGNKRSRRHTPCRCHKTIVPVARVNPQCLRGSFAPGCQQMAVESSIQLAAVSSETQSLLTMRVGLTLADYDNLCVSLCEGDTTRRHTQVWTVRRTGGGRVNNTEHK